MPEDSSQPRTSRERAQERTKAWWRRHPRLAMAVAGGLGAAAVTATVTYGPRGCGPPPPNVAWPSCGEISESMKESASLDGYDPTRWAMVIEWRHGTHEGWQDDGACARLPKEVADAARANPDSWETRCALVEFSDDLEDWCQGCEPWSFGQAGAYIAVSPVTQGIDFFPTTEACVARCGRECAV